MRLATRKCPGRLFAILSVTLLAITLSVRTAAASSVLFEHDFPTTNQQPAWCSSCAGDMREWDAFDLTARDAITGIDALLFLYPDPSSQPPMLYSVWDQTRTTKLFEESFTASDFTATAVPLLDPFAYLISAPITGLTLDAGTYYLSIFSPDPSAYLGWYESPTTATGRSVQSTAADPLVLDGSGSGHDLAVRILGSPARTDGGPNDPAPVPEPASLLLLGTGLIMAGRRAHSRRRE